MKWLISRDKMHWLNQSKRNKEDVAAGLDIIAHIL